MRFTLKRTLCVTTVCGKGAGSSGVSSRGVTGVLQKKFFPLTCTCPGRGQTIQSLLEEQLCCMQRGTRLSIRLRGAGRRCGVGRPLVTSGVTAGGCQSAVDRGFSGPTIISVISSSLCLCGRCRLVVSGVRGRVGSLMGLRLPRRFGVLRAVPNFNFIVPLAVLCRVKSVSHFGAIKRFLSCTELIGYARGSTSGGTDKNRGGVNGMRLG